MQRIHIERSAIDNSLYVQLQQKMLEELQRLSGNKWTNFNVHDPGVTTGDIGNYAISEFDYKLGFDLIDYLTFEQVNFNPDRYGMFLPEKVYSTTPVTLDDYRRLFLSHVRDLDNVVVELSASKRYTVKYVPSPFVSEGRGEDIATKIKEIYSSNRNLCEMLGEVTKSKLTELYLHSEFEVESADIATNVLSQMYWCIMSYLNGGVHFERIEQLHEKEYSWERLFEGPKSGKKMVIPQQENTMEELLHMLLSIDGLKSIKTCYLSKKTEDLNDVVTEFKEWYSLAIPQDLANLKVRISVEGKEIANIDISKFKKKLNALYVLNRSSTNPNGEDENLDVSRKFIPKGKYRNVYIYRSIAQDFPACYRAEITDFKQFGAYLKLFDMLLQKGLDELRDINNLLSIEIFEGVTTLSPETSRGVGERRNAYAIKSQYLDFLDHLYGVESNQEWIREFNQESQEETLKRRMIFLRNIPFLLQTRSKGYNTIEPDFGWNVPTIQIYLELLLGLVELKSKYMTKDTISDVEFTLIRAEEKRISLCVVESFTERRVTFAFSLITGSPNEFAFQNKIECLIRNLLPAHLAVHVSWLSLEKFCSFKESYKHWRLTLLEGNAESQEKRLEQLEDIVRSVEND